MTHVTIEEAVNSMRLRKPQSKLQKLHCRSNWLIHFNFHRVHQTQLNVVAPTSKTKALLAQYNILVLELKKSIKQDADSLKKHILRERKKLLDES